MSGGSFNYLCFKDWDELFGSGSIEEMEKMVSRLIELGYEDVAKETLQLKLTIQQSSLRIQTMKERLQDVWKAVEWSDSGDWGNDSVDKAVKKYRGE